jgi:DNA modification methylase
MKIRMVDPRTLQAAPYNPRRPLTSAERTKLRTSLETFGFLEPLVVNSRTGWLVGGHQRASVAAEMGLSRIPVVDVDLDPDQEMAANSALNNRELQGDFDPQGLVDVLAHFDQTPLLEAAGFDYDQYQALRLATLADKSGREGATPPLRKTATSKVGQTWQLGQHRLHVGDCTSTDAYKDQPAPAAMCFTDPPYNVGYVGKTAEALTIDEDRQSDPDYSDFLYASLLLVGRNCTGAIYCCHAISKAATVHHAWDRAGLHYSNTIAWVKDRFVLGHGDYHHQWEAILYGWPKAADGHWWIGERTHANVWEHPVAKRGDQGRRGPSDVWRHQRPSASREHPTMKPVSLVEHAIRNSCPPGCLVLDPFAGSGSTLVAAENLGRPSYNVEVDPAYADVIIGRWESLDTGDKPKRIGGPK